MQNKTLSQLEIDGVPSFYIGMYGVCTHRMGLLDIPVWCKNPEAAINLINNYSQQKPKPKCWTVEDQKAGQLPEVGCMVMVTSVDECASVAAINNDAVCVVFHDGEFITLHKSGISPIETPEEKAQREEDAFVDSESFFIDVCTMSGPMKAAYKQGARAAYRKLKGGE